MTDLTASSTGPVAHKIDSLESVLLALGNAVELPVTHRFPPGAYVREIFMPAGTLLTSKIHKTEHMYIVLTGKVSVFSENFGVEHIQAPYIGTTTPGTRRVLYIHEDCRWLTFHPTPDGETDLQVIEDRLIEHHLLPDGRDPFEEYTNLLDLQERLLRELPPQEDYVGAP